MSEHMQMLEEMKAYTYFADLSLLDDILVCVEKVIEDDVFGKLKFEENRAVYEENITDALLSVSRETVEKIRNEYSAFASQVYPTDVLFKYREQLLKSGDFVGKKDVLEVFNEAYLFDLHREAKLECALCRDLDCLLDHFNNPKYRDVREEAIVPKLTDKMAELLPLENVGFSSIDEAAMAYEKNKTSENLAKLKKLHMVKAVEDTEHCNDRDKLGEMLNSAKLDCVKTIIIKRLAYLDAKDL